MAHLPLPLLLRDPHLWILARVIMFVFLIALTTFHPIMRSASSSSLTSHAPIIIVGNASFTSANGVTSGTGRSGDPYIIQRWDVNASLVNGITVVNTTAYFEINNVNVHDGLRGIFLENATNGVLETSEFSRNQVGVILQSSPNNTIAGNTGFENGAGIEANYSPHVMVSNNTISMDNGNTVPGNGSNAIFLANCNWSIIYGNKVSTSLWGIFVRNSEGVEIAHNLAFANGTEGIHVENSVELTIAENNSTQNRGGITVLDAPNSIVSNNNVTWNTNTGLLVQLEYLKNNVTLVGNSFRFNGWGMECCMTDDNVTIVKNSFVGDGLTLDPSYGVPSPLDALKLVGNQVNGKPLAFYDRCANSTIDAIPVGQVIAVNCRNIVLSDLRITNTSVGIQFINVNDTLVTRNIINSNSGGGFWETGGRNITVTSNNISNNGGYAIYPLTQLSPPSGTKFVVYHNNFVEDSVNGNGGGIWDNGYPSGGNYWTHYSGVDNCSGPSQNICPSPDGIGDTPFHTYGATDQYPLIRPYLTGPDTIPPSWLPQSVLRISNVSTTSFTLSWPLAAADDVGIDHYQLYQDNKPIANRVNISPSALQIYLSGLTPGTTYTFRIEAIDLSGNPSTDGPSVTFTMPLTGGGSSQSPIPWWLIWTAVSSSITVAVIAFSILVIRNRKKTQVGRTTPDQTKQILGLRCFVCGIGDTRSVTTAEIA